MAQRGEQDYREGGETIRFPDTDETRLNMTEILRRGAGEEREDRRSERAERRYQRRERTLRRT